MIGNIWNVEGNRSGFCLRSLRVCAEYVHRVTSNFLVPSPDSTLLLSSRETAVMKRKVILWGYEDEKAPCRVGRVLGGIIVEISSIILQSLT